MASGELEVLELKPPNKTEKPNKLNSGTIKRYRIKDITYNDFYWQYLETNYPVVLTEVSTQWECRQNWLTTQYPAEISKEMCGNELFTGTNINTTINYDYLKRKIGNCQVPVANCNKEYFNSHAKCEMSFYDFLHYWQNKRGDLQLHDHTSTDYKNRDTDSSNRDKKTTTDDLLYLKDWHLRTQYADYDFYKVPKHFASDWLNEHLMASQSDDYRFVYMGPENTWTPFHSDVFGSFSWSTNIMGIKKWLLLPPGEELKLTDRLGNLPFRIDEQILDDNNVQYFTLMQRENESLFVPSGWYHQVSNVTDTISINHNWFNACNLQRIWLNLNQQMENVIKEIDDCRQMDNFMDHCQTMLRVSFGLNYLDFLQLLESITKRRLEKLNNNTATTNNIIINDNSSLLSASLSPASFKTSSNLMFFEQYLPNDYHIYHDLQRILLVIELMLQDQTLCDDRTTLYRKCIHLRELLSSALLSQYTLTEISYADSESVNIHNYN